jgi:hypothetical protein
VHERAMRRWWLFAAAAVPLWLACLPDVINHGDLPDGGDAGACGSDSECPCGELCFSADGGGATCNTHPPPSCTMTSDCVPFSPHDVCSETFRAGTSCGLSCHLPDAG